MSDASHLWLSEQLRSNADNADTHDGPHLWLADENTLDSTHLLLNTPLPLSTITNRFDIAQALESAGVEVAFSDFDFSTNADNSLSAIYYRVSKEKPVVHHIINQAFRTLTEGGRLYLSGQKSDGTKTYWDKARKLFGDSTSITKQGNHYHGYLVKSAAHNDQNLLDTKDYPDLRPIADTVTPGNTPIKLVSKPGVFGWNKIDLGSAFLSEHLQGFIENLPTAPNRLLDLGCGYGYLTLMTKDLPLAERTATDNNAAALQAAKENFTLNQMDVTLLADDCGQSLTGKFELILCNPPFHQGFSIDSRLTDKFLQQTARLLSSTGGALFVVNQFIPLERKARDYFACVELFAENRSFKLIRLSH